MALDIERIALAEVRLLRQARAGEAGALSELVAPYAAGLWTVCVAACPQPSDQRHAWEAFQDTLKDAIRDFQVDKPVGVQLFAQLWQGLALDIRQEPTPEPASPPIPRPLPSRSEAADRTRVLNAVHALSASDRLVWAFTTVTGLDMDRLAALTGAGESSLRAAYARASWAVYRALTE